MYFQRGWCEVVDSVPDDLEIIRGWDLAATEARPGSDPDWTVGIKMGKSYSTGSAISFCTPSGCERPRMACKRC